jgi:hypothetical protein
MDDISGQKWEPVDKTSDSLVDGKEAFFYVSAAER